MAKNIRGNNDGNGGRNESYTINGRGEVKRKKLVREVEAGNHPDFSIYEINKEKYVRGNPDSKESNNINR